MSCEVRALSPTDLDAVAEIYREATGGSHQVRWRQRIEALLSQPAETSVALAATAAGSGEVIGYLAGEIRSWEFGSEPAGWIFGLGVAEGWRREGVARDLLRAAVRALRERGAQSVRTMVRRDEVSVLRFFRSAGFAVGPYKELELRLEEG